MKEFLSVYFLKLKWILLPAAGVAWASVAIQTVGLWIARTWFSGVFGGVWEFVIPAVIAVSATLLLAKRFGYLYYKMSMADRIIPSYYFFMVLAMLLSNATYFSTTSTEIVSDQEISSPPFFRTTPDFSIQLHEKPDEGVGSQLQDRYFSLQSVTPFSVFLIGMACLLIAIAFPELSSEKIAMYKKGKRNGDI